MVDLVGHDCVLDDTLKILFGQARQHQPEFSQLSGPMLKEISIIASPRT